jgi:hypothetical protein
MDELVEGTVLPAELLSGDACDELRAGFAMDVEELLPAPVRKEMRLVLGGEECRLMMVEPPGEAVVRAVFEIDDGVLVPVELIAVERVARPVHRRGVGHLRRRVHRRFIEFGEDRGTRHPVETIAVIKYAQLHVSRSSPAVSRS